MRDPKPWYRKSTDSWYAQVNRRQTCLAKGRDNRQEAKRKLAEILAGVRPVKTDSLTAAHPVTSADDVGQIDGFCGQIAQRCGQQNPLVRSRPVFMDRLVDWQRNIGQRIHASQDDRADHQIRWSISQ